MRVKSQRSKVKSRTSGFTMLETIVAFALLLAAVLGPVTLITRGIFGFLTSKNKLVALQLAQEGLELVHVIRENNVLCQAAGVAGANWRQDFDGGVSILGSDRRIDATNIFNRTCASIVVKNPTLSAGCLVSPLLIDSGRYGYISGQPSNFTRCVTVSEPASGEGTFPFIIGRFHMMDVVVRVGWQERGNTKNVELRERLYNWR